MSDLKAIRERDAECLAAEFALATMGDLDRHTLIEAYDALAAENAALREALTLAGDYGREK